MSKVRILVRGSVLVTAVLVLAGCASKSTIAPGGGGSRAAGACGSGAGKADRNAPIICVDDSGAALSVSPDPIHVHSVGQADRQPVVIHWWTRSGGNTLNLEIQEGCVTDVTCNGPHCTARTLPQTERKRCKYDVWTQVHPVLDPEIVVDPCC
jgi:hypothetical protein